MNWYKKSQINKESGDMAKAFFGLTIPAIALLLSLSQFEVQGKIQENPQQLAQQIQQVQTTEPNLSPTEPNIPSTEPKVETGTVSQEDLEKYFKDEYKVILNAAKRNNLAPEDYDLLFSIRKSEAGGKRREFGIISDKCDAIMDKRPNDTLDIQAGWAAMTIVKNRARWEKAGKPGDFITFLGKRYAPKGVKNDPDKLNKNWIKNVSTWEKRI
jgi:hypothetical protein